MFEDIPVGVGVVYEGERIRRKFMQVELGGSRIPYKFELASVKPLKQVKDGKITIIGPDIKDMKEGSSNPIGIRVDVAGKKVTKDLEGVIERRIHMFINYIEGFMHLAQRYDVQIRLSKDSFKKGLKSLKYVGKVLERLFKSDLPIVEKAQITFITDPKKVEKEYKKALKVYEERDVRARGMNDEDIDEFYGCVLCQSFAPTHMCVITPQRPSLCGSVSWFDARASAKVDPKGPNFLIEKGELLDPVKGEYSGVNKTAAKKSMNEFNRVYLYSMFGYPHTSCGCFEAVAFYIPEVDGIGIVNRGFKGETVNGLPFSTMADQTGGGRQTEGFLGASFGYMRSPRFFQADGGWERIVWMPSNVKDRVKDAIPKDLRDKIATEADATTVEDLKTFLEKKGHPIVKRWAAKVPEVVAKVAEAPPKVEPTPKPVTPSVSVPTVSLPVGSIGRVKIVLKGVRIHADKVIVKRGKEGS